MPDRLYLTGFGAFPGVEVNPTAALVAELHGRRFGDLEVIGEVLPVSWRQAADRCALAVAALRPRAVVHLGLAATATTVRIEGCGVNELAFRVPDVTGEQPLALTIDDGLPLGHTLVASWDIAALAAELMLAGLAAEPSHDAGRYVCNATYFASLQAQARGGPPALFVHVPPLGARAHAADPPWDHARLLAGCARVLDWLGARLGPDRRG